MNKSFKKRFSLIRSDQRSNTCQLNWLKHTMDKCLLITISLQLILCIFTKKYTYQMKPRNSILIILGFFFVFCHI